MLSSWSPVQAQTADRRVDAYRPTASKADRLDILKTATPRAEDESSSISSVQSQSLRVETVRGVALEPSLAVPKTPPAGPQPGSFQSMAPGAVSMPRGDAEIANRAPSTPGTTPPLASETEVDLAVLPASKPPASPPQGAAESEDPADGEIQWSNKSAALGSTSEAVAGGPNSQAGRAMDLAVPMRDGQFYLGDVAGRVSPGNEVSLQKERLVQLLQPLLREPALAALKAIPDDQGYIALAAIQQSGFAMQFDAATVEVQFEPSPEQRSKGRLSASNKSEDVRSENMAAPATVAGYLNMRAGADYSSEPFGEAEDAAGARVAFDGAMRWSAIVFESSATFGLEDGFSRGASRFVFDRPEDALRFSAGDVTPLRTEWQSGGDLLGFSVEKSYQKLQPAANIRPTGSRSFRVERPSKVDVTVNGYVAQRLQLRPGDYDLADLPLSPGANDIALIIEDDVGNKRTLDFTVFSGRTLLAPGISEWSLAAGFASHYASETSLSYRSLYSDREYDFTEPIVTGLYERGLTPDLTGTLHMQADPDAVLGGTGAAVQTSFGLWQFDAAVSQSARHGHGHAAGIGYELANIEGGDGIARSLRLAADYRSENFAADGTIETRSDTGLDLFAVYAQELPWKTFASLSGSYSLGRGSWAADSYGVDISLSRAFAPSLTAFVTAGFEETLGEVHDGESDAFTASLRLSYRIDALSGMDAGHDLARNRSHLSYRRHEGSGVGSWNAQLEVDRSADYGGGTGDADGYGVNGSFSTVADRAELAVSHHSGLAGLDTQSLVQRTGVTAGTAIAFADGRIALGRPVSNGFAIIGMHDNLPDSGVIVGASRDESQAASGLFGPALVSGLSGYSPGRIPYDVENLPVGYDLGAGVFDVFPAYKSGYGLTIGSEYTVTAFGSLVDAGGEPIALLTGTAVEEGVEGGRSVTVFTNRVGKFGAQGLRPGKWLLTMETEPKTRFALNIPKDAVGLVKLDTLKPVEAAP